MKGLKYIFIIFLFCFINITPVIAKEELMKCEYKKLYVKEDNSLYIKYRVTLNDDNTVTHEYVPYGSTNYQKASNAFDNDLLNNVSNFNDKDKSAEATSIKSYFTLSEMKKYYNKGVCPYALYTESNTGMADRKITPVDTYNANKYKSDSTAVAKISLRTSQNINKNGNTEPNNNNNSNNSRSASCVYEANKNYVNPVIVTCNADNNTVNCNSSNATVSSSAYSSLTPNDFKTNNVFLCKDNMFITMENSTITDITFTNKAGYERLYKNKSKSRDGSNQSGGNTGITSETPPEPTIKEDYENDERYIAAKKEADKYCNETDFINNDSAKCEAARKKMNEIKASYDSSTNDINLSLFCQKDNVVSVFRALGWLFFTLKILIPIILIVFGSIDVMKAVIGNKDDELKKAAKTLVIRAIAGIIIFFIPTLINFVVKLIGGDNIYNGTKFGPCTNCVLNPGSCKGAE